MPVLVGGGAGSNVGVRLLADGEEVLVWRGSGKQFLEAFSGNNVEPFNLIVYPLAAVAGQPLQLELYDNDPEGHIMLDHVLLVQEVGTRTAVADARPRPARGRLGRRHCAAPRSAGVWTMQQRRAAHHLLASGGAARCGQRCETVVGRGRVLGDGYGERWYLP